MKALTTIPSKYQNRDPARGAETVQSQAWAEGALHPLSQLDSARHRPPHRGGTGDFQGNQYG